MYKDLFFDSMQQLEEISKMMSNDYDAQVKFTNAEHGFLPRFDIINHEKSIQLVADMPGIEKEDINISVNEEKILTISGVKKKTATEVVEKESSKNTIRSERQFGEFSRQIMMPENIDAEKIVANFENGVLDLNIAIKEPVKPKEITINIG